MAAERAGPRVPARVQLLQLRPARGHVSGRPLRHVRAAGGLAVSAGLLRRGQRCSDCFTASYIMFSPDITCGETSSRRLIESQLKFSPCGRLPPTHTATRRKLKPVFRNIQFLEDKGFLCCSISTARVGISFYVMTWVFNFHYIDQPRQVL